MTRGHPPLVAIAEAERRARAMGLTVFSLEPKGGLPFHFVTLDRPCISLVRVRRLKYAGYDVAEINQSCRNDIAAIRAISVTQEIFRQLWARGPDRHWYRYLVLPDSVEVLEDDDDAESEKPEGGGIPPSPFQQDAAGKKNRAGVPLPA